MQCNGLWGTLLSYSDAIFFICSLHLSSVIVCLSKSGLLDFDLGKKKKTLNDSTKKKNTKNNKLEHECVHS